MKRTSKKTKPAKAAKSRTTVTSKADGSASANVLPSPATSKQEAILKLLRRPGGANITAVVQVTGWQPHSVRGFLAGVVRKKLGLPLVSEKVKGERRYRLEKQP